MAKTDSKATPAGVKDCHVAALGEEFMRFILIRSALDQAHTKSKDEVERTHLDSLAENNRAFMAGVKDRATYLQAESANGALLQLGFVADFIDDLMGRVEDCGDDGLQIEAAIHRLLHSIASFIENTSSARRQETGADYFLDRRLSPFVKLGEAARIAAEASEREPRAADGSRSS